MKFRQDIQDTNIDTSVYGTETIYETEIVTGTIDWELYIEARSYGIKDIGVYITDFKLTLLLGGVEGEDFSSNKALNFELDNLPEGFTYQTEGLEEINIGTIITITSLEIDFKQKSLTFIFN